jgi:tight adherence protein C
VTMTLLLPLLAFLCGSVLVGAAYLVLSPSRGSALERRLGEVTGRPEAVLGESDGGYKKILTTLKKVGHAAPSHAGEASGLRKKLTAAGYRGPDAMAMFQGVRVATALLFFLVAMSPLVPRTSVAVPLGACGVGYLMTGMGLGRLAKRRQHRIRLGLPDALDLMVVSVEAGLGLDQAIMRVSEEMAFAHKDLSDELRLVNLEMRAGTGRVDALKNLADRTDVDDVLSLVAMLIQTDKFGTSVAQSLRVHSDTVRTKRRQRAEEAAAKTGVKMVFPLVFCIFPSIWVVTIGPAAIKFVQVLFPMASK